MRSPLACPWRRRSSATSATRRSPTDRRRLWPGIGRSSTSCAARCRRPASRIWIGSGSWTSSTSCATPTARPPTSAAGIRFIRGFIGWARDEGYAISPSLVSEHGEHWFAIRKPTEVQLDITTYSQEDLERISDAAAHTGDTFTAQRNRLFIRLLAGTGLRLTEALSLELKDVQEDRLRVRSGKGRKPRWVPLSGRLQRDLNRYIERIRPDEDSDRLFVLRDGRPMTGGAVASLFRRIRAEVGFRVHPHGLRHTFATEYLRRGGEIERLRRILGHTSYAMVSRYVHLAGADLGRGIDELAPY